MVVTLAAILLLLLLSAFFSGSETALTAASRPRMHQLERKGAPRAAIVNRLRERKDRTIGAILLGNNLVNVLASALATSLLIGVAGDAGVAYATAAMTLLILVFGEVLPKTYALQNPDRAALLLAPVFRVLMAALGPLAAGVQIVIRAMLASVGLYSRESEERGRALEELRGAIELHSGQASAAQERAMLRSILDLDDVEVEMVMRHRKDVTALDADLPASRIVDEALSSPYTRIPLWRGAIELHSGQASAAQERAMLRSILDLDDVEVEMVMRHRKDVTALDADLPASRIVDEALSSPYTRIPLWRGQPDNVVAVLHAKELARAVRAHEGDLDALEIDKVASDPWFVPESTTLLHQLQAFRRRHEHFALVVDEYGSLMGIITLEDVIEEIVGEITDEHDVVLDGVLPQRDGSCLVDGGVTVRDLNRRFEWSLPDQEAATIAGLVIAEAKIIPEIGQIFVFHGFRFEILRRQSNRLTRIRISPGA